MDKFHVVSSLIGGGVAGFGIGYYMATRHCKRLLEELSNKFLSAESLAKTLKKM